MGTPISGKSSARTTAPSKSRTCHRVLPSISSATRTCLRLLSVILDIQGFSTLRLTLLRCLMTSTSLLRMGGLLPLPATSTSQLPRQFLHVSSSRSPHCASSTSSCASTEEGPSRAAPKAPTRSIRTSTRCQRSKTRTQSRVKMIWHPRRVPRKTLGTYTTLKSL